MEDMVNPESQALPVQSEKMIPQSQVNDLVGRVRQEVNEKWQREAQTQSQLSEERARQIAEEVATTHSDNVAKAQYERAQKQAAQEILNQFNSKIEAAKEKYPDIKEKVARLNLATMPHLIQHAMSVDNTADFMMELATNPGKALDIMGAERIGNHPLALDLSQRLSSSINDNLKAAAQADNTTKEPIRHIKPSSSGGDDGNMSIAELRKQKHLRG